MARHATITGMAWRMVNAFGVVWCKSNAFRVGGADPKVSFRWGFIIKNHLLYPFVECAMMWIVSLEPKKGMTMGEPPRSDLREKEQRAACRWVLFERTAARRRLQPLPVPPSSQCGKEDVFSMSVESKGILFRPFMGPIAWDSDEYHEAVRVLGSLIPGVPAHGHFQHRPLTTNPFEFLTFPI